MQDLMLPKPFLKPFPSPETVFVEPVARYQRFLSPLVSIDISAVDPDLSGWVHLVSPIEPYDGLLGQISEQAWGPYLQPNWIGFRLTPEGRYQLLGDFEFFEAAMAESEGEVDDMLSEYYDEQHESFSVRKVAFQQTGQVCVVMSSGDLKPMAALSQLGGVAPVCNMFWSNVPGAAFTYSKEEAAPRTMDGRPYRFVAAVPGWHYRASGADNILLFYDPVERVVLETFVFT